jgi:phospholipid/cholesterol/gamma-HCH transport system substrate-binding protein
MKKEFKVGLIVLVAVALFVYGFNFLKGINVFKKETKIYAVFVKNDGLLEASPLMISGYKVGQVTKLDLIKKDTSYNVLVTFVLNENISIPKNSIARLVSQDLLGTKAVALELGDSQLMVKNGDTLTTAFQEALSSEVRKELQPLKVKIEGLVGSMDSVVDIVNEIMNQDVRKSLVESFTSIKNAVISLEQSTNKVNSLINQEEGTIVSILSKINSITKNIADNNQKIDLMIDNFAAISDSVAKSNIKQTIENTNKALTQANILLAEVSEGKGSLGKLLKDPSLYNNLNKSAKDLDMLMKDLRFNPERYLHFSVFGRKTPMKPIPEDTIPK